MKNAELEKLSKWLHAQFHDKTNDVIFRGLCQLAHAQCQNILKGHGNDALLKLQRRTLQEVYAAIVARNRASIKIVD